MSSHERTLPGEPVWVALFSSDAERSRSFYQELFGWSSSPGPLENGEFFALDDAPVAGFMANSAGGGLPDAWTTFLLTDDADALASSVLAHGGEVLLSDAVGELGTMVLLRDNTGATVGAWQKGSHPGYTLSQVPGAPIWHELHSMDYPTSVSFYNAVFGWAPISIGDTDEFRMVILGDEADSSAGIYDASRDGQFQDSTWVVYFAVASTDETVTRAIELGAALAREAEDTPYGRLADLVDPAGVPFRVMQLPGD